MSAQKLSIEDRVAIEELIVRFFYLGDHDRGEETTDLFTEDGVFSAMGMVMEGREQLEMLNAQRKAAGLVTRHVVTNTHIEVVGPDEVNATSIVAGFRAPEKGADPIPAAIVDYIDVLQRVDGEWKFKSRKIEPVFFSQN